MPGARPGISALGRLVSVFLDHAVLAGIAHAQVHNQGNADHDGDIPIKAAFPTAILEAQRRQTG